MCTAEIYVLNLRGLFFMKGQKSCQMKSLNTQMILQMDYLKAMQAVTVNPTGIVLLLKAK